MKAVLRRLLYAPLILLLLLTATFVLIRAAPGGPFSAERNLPPEIEQAMKARFHLDEPIHVQYWRTLTGAVRGDFGPSMKHRDRAVRDIVAAHLPASLLLGGLAFCLALALGLTAGTVAASRVRIS